jgi:hypothetical protein
MRDPFEYCHTARSALSGNALPGSFEVELDVVDHAAVACLAGDVLSFEVQFDRVGRVAGGAREPSDLCDGMCFAWPVADRPCRGEVLPRVAQGVVVAAEPFQNTGYAVFDSRTVGRTPRRAVDDIQRYGPLGEAVPALMTQHD